MTEKRFTINFDKRVIVDAKTNAEYGFLVELKTILNELNDENEQLKKELNTFKPVVFQDTTNNGTILLYAKEYGDVDD